ELAAQPTVVRVSMQTNGVLPNEPWLDLFDEVYPGRQIGISLDGDAQGNAWRVGYDGEPVYPRVASALRLLADRGRTVGVIAAVTPVVLGRAEAVLDHLTGSGSGLIGCEVGVQCSSGTRRVEPGSSEIGAVSEHPRQIPAPPWAGVGHGHLGHMERDLGEFALIYLGEHANSWLEERRGQLDDRSVVDRFTPGELGHCSTQCHRAGRSRDLHGRCGHDSARAGDESLEFDFGECECPCGRADPGEVTQERKMQTMGDEGDCRPGEVLAGPCGLHICGGGTAQPCAKGLPGVFVPGYGADPGAVSQNPGLCEQGCVLPAGPFQCFRGPGVCSGIDV